MGVNNTVQGLTFKIGFFSFVDDFKQTKRRQRLFCQLKGHHSWSHRIYKSAFFLERAAVWLNLFPKAAFSSNVFKEIAEEVPF